MNAYLETLLSLAFLFAGLSVIASSILELLAELSNRRGRFLRQMLQAMLPESHARLTGHVLYQSLALTGANRSYLDQQIFARLILSLQKSDQLSSEEAATIEPLMVGAVGESEQLGNIESWFRAAMDHVSGAYKRWSQVWLFAIGLVVCTGINFDVVRVAQAVYQSEDLRTELVNKAIAEAQEEHPSSARVRAALDRVTPVGTSPGCANAPGILLGAIGISWGAQFWFDLLKQLVNLRGDAAGAARRVVAQ